MPHIDGAQTVATSLPCRVQQKPGSELAGILEDDDIILTRTTSCIDATLLSNAMKCPAPEEGLVGRCARPFLIFFMDEDC